MAKKKKEKQKKILFIQIETPVANAVDKYCDEAGINKEDLSFALGYLTGKVNDKDEGPKQLFMLLQAYFFAGILYGKTEKFTFKYLSKKKRDEKVSEADSKLLELLKKKKPVPSYMG
jgi:hypothetical protein